MKKNNKIRPELASFILAATLLNTTAFAGFLPISVEKVKNISNQTEAEKILSEIEANKRCEVQEESSGETRLQKALLRSVTPAGALAYMVFILLYFPCIATFVAIKNESGGWKWAILTAVYTIVLAWVAAFITFNVFSFLS